MLGNRTLFECGQKSNCLRILSVMTKIVAFILWFEVTPGERILFAMLANTKNAVRTGTVYR